MFVRNLMRRMMPVLRIRNLQRRVAEIQLGNGGPVLAAGRQLAEAHAAGARASEVLAAAADEALRTEPRLAADLVDAAVRAGGLPHAVTARHAQAAALAGDATRALRLADEALTTAGSTQDDRRRAAVVLAQPGFAARAAELYEGLGASEALLATGDREQARAVLAAAPPTESAAELAVSPQASRRDGVTGSACTA